MVERTKTGKDWLVLLNERALRALELAKNYAERRTNGKGRVTETPLVFPPPENAELVQQTSNLHHQWRPVLKDLGIRYRLPYNCRHTYATMRAMFGLNPAFIAQQLGHSVQILLNDVCTLDQLGQWLAGARKAQDWSEIGPQLRRRLISY